METANSATKTTNFYTLTPRKRAQPPEFSFGTNGLPCARPPVHKVNHWFRTTNQVAVHETGGPLTLIFSLALVILLLNSPMLLAPMVIFHS
jgi:hypothetical protein